MGNTKKNAKVVEKIDLNKVLGLSVDLDSLFDTHPQLFNLGRLPIQCKIELLHSDPARFQPYIDVTKFDPYEKAEVVLRLNNKGIVKLVTFTDAELARVPLGLYGRLVQKDFGYIRKELYDKMLKGDQTEVFLRHPEWVMSTLDKQPKLTKIKLRDLSVRKPKFIDNYVTDFSQYSTGDTFWKNMIKFDNKYKQIFLRNTGTCTSKTEVRAVVWAFPDLIKMLDGEVLMNSKLTCKEWLLLANSVMDVNEAVFKDWEFSDDVKELFRMDLMAELLNGKSTLTKRFQNAMKGVFGNKEEAENNEDTTMVGSTP